MYLSSDELNKLREQVTSLEAEVTNLGARRWATIEHAHMEYVDKEQLQSVSVNL